MNARDRLLAQFLNAAPAQFPQGKIHKTDEGELAMALSTDQKTKTVIIRFGKPVDWMGFKKEDALNLARALTEHANEL